MENKELPEGLLEEVARAICFEKDPLKTDDWNNWVGEAKAALSVIAPYYEKRFATIKEQMQSFIDYHNDRADAAEKQIEELKEQLESKNDCRHIFTNPSRLTGQERCVYCDTRKPPAEDK